MIGTIIAPSGAPLGPHTRIAKSDGLHPFTCDAYNALVQGQTSVLNWPEDSERQLAKTPMLTKIKSHSVWCQSQVLLYK